jgi:hypothetical protein
VGVVDQPVENAVVGERGIARPSGRVAVAKDSRAYLITVFADLPEITTLGSNSGAGAILQARTALSVSKETSRTVMTTGPKSDKAPEPARPDEWR